MTTHIAGTKRIHATTIPTGGFIALGGLVTALSLTACADTLRPLGPTPAVSEAHASQLFDAFIARFAPTELSPKYDAARVKMAQAALTPSRVFNDTAVWNSGGQSVVQPSPASPSTPASTALPATSPTSPNPPAAPTQGGPFVPSARSLHISGGLIADGRYRLDVRPTLTPFTRPGDSRHTIDLEQLSPNTFRWNTDVGLAIGSIGAEGMSVLISTLLRAPNGRTERELREDFASSFPRAQAAFAKGFVLDSLHVAPGAAGTTSVTATITFHPDLMKPSYPALAGYVDKYLGPAKYHFLLSDKSGAALLDAVGRDRSLTLRYRLQQGALTSLFGPPRPWADSLELRADLSLKVKIFTVGFHSMLADFIVGNEGHDRSWTVVTQHEPKWDLPFVTERLIRSPLRHPFDGGGSMFRLGVRDSASSQSVFSRRTRLEVQESAIMRFIGSLVSHAIGDLDARVEAEEDRFIHDGFEALQADLKTVAPHWRAAGTQ